MLHYKINERMQEKYGQPNNKLEFVIKFHTPKGSCIFWQYLCISINYEQLKLSLASFVKKIEIIDTKSGVVFLWSYNDNYRLCASLEESAASSRT